MRGWPFSNSRKICFVQLIMLKLLLHILFLQACSLQSDIIAVGIEYDKVYYDRACAAIEQSGLQRQVVSWFCDTINIHKH